MEQQHAQHEAAIMHEGSAVACAAAPRRVSAGERADRAASNAGEPCLEFAGSTPYDDYVRTKTLHALQQPVTNHPAERAFLVNTQVMELYFGLLRTEWEHAQQQLRADNLDGTLAALARSVYHFEVLNASWRSLIWLTPAEFNDFRDALGEASGFQSYAYRHVEFLLGLKEAARIRPHHGSPDIYADLNRALNAPSLYDDAVALLARSGLGPSAPASPRSYADEYHPDPAVEAAWSAIYADPRATNPLFQLGEQLTEIADAFTTWRQRHLMAVKRAMGAKPGSGGSPGLTWLERSTRREVFPELWSARTAV